MDYERNGRRRVVITGIGALTPLGATAATWNGLIEGRSGIRPYELVDTSRVFVDFGGEVPAFDPLQYLTKKEVRQTGRATQFAVAAAMMAADDAGLSQEQLIERGEDVAVYVGSTMASHELFENATYRYKSEHQKRPQAVAMVNGLVNMPAHYVSKYFQALGPLNAPSTACAAGTQAIGEAADLLRYGRAEMAFAGGVEALLQDYTVSGFDAMHLLASRYDDDPAKASRPFDRDRSGFVFSEGVGIVLLETLESAHKRGAKIYAEILGHGASSDAYHVAIPEPSGRGVKLVMQRALKDAGINGDAVGYINAHGTGTQVNDVMETESIKHVLGEHAYDIAVSSTKSMLGHAMAASGAIEAVVGALILQQQVIPPTINLDNPDTGCDLDYVPHTARQVQDLDVMVSNSFGLGGQNAALVLGRV